MDRRRWLVAIAVLFAVNGIVAGSWLSRIVDLQAGAGLDVAGLAIALIIKRVGSLGSGPLAAWAIGARGSRASAVAGAGLNAAVLVLLPVLPGLALGLGLALLSMTDSLADLAMNVQGTQWEAGSRRSMLQRLYGGWSLVPALGAAAGGGAIALGLTPAAHLGGIAVLGAVAAAGTWPFLSPEDPAPMTAEPPTRRSFGRMAVLLALLGAGTATVEVIPTEWVTVAMIEDLGVSPERAGLALTVLAVAMLVSRGVGDRMEDALGRGRAWRLACAIAVAGITLMAVSDAFTVRIIGVALTSFGMAQLFPAAYRAAATSRELSPGAGLAAMSTGAKMGVLGANVVMAAAAGTVSVGAGMWFVVAPAAIAVAVVSLRLEHSHAASH